LIIVANAFFVAQEFAYMSVDRAQLRTLATNGDVRAQRALTITQKTNSMLSGAQLVITVTGLLIGYVAEPLVGQGLGVLLGGVGVPAAVSVGVGTILALAASTIATMLFAELFPKNYTIAAPMKSALWLATPTIIFLKIFGPLVHFFEYSSNAILKTFKIEPLEDVDSSATSGDCPRAGAKAGLKQPEGAQLVLLRRKPSGKCELLITQDGGTEVFAIFARVQ